MLSAAQRRVLVSHVRLLVPVVLVLVSILLIGYAFYGRGRSLLQTEVRSRLLAIVQVASLQFEGIDIDRLDPASAAYNDVAVRLDQIRQRSGLRFAYILGQRGTDIVFLADGDAALTADRLDENRDGVVSEDERAAIPGEVYDVSGVEELLSGLAFRQPAVGQDFTRDQWGTFLSAYAPIYASNGRLVGTLAVDLPATDYEHLTQAIFSPVAFLLLVLAAIMIAGYILLVLYRRRHEMLRRVEEMRAGLLQLTFHQLGAPLTALKWSLESLQEYQQQHGQSTLLQEHVSIMQEAMTYMGRLLEDLQRAGSVSAGKVTYQAGQADLVVLVKAVVAEFQQRADRSQKFIVLEAPSQLPLSIDAKLIAGVLREVVDNALTFSTGGTTVTIRVAPVGRWVRVEVEDQGVGIPAADMERIFREFGRARNAAKLHPKGSGLGLYISRGVVEQAGGTMSVRSREGKGSTFLFTLPLV